MAMSLRILENGEFYWGREWPSERGLRIRNEVRHGGVFFVLFPVP